VSAQWVRVGGMALRLLFVIQLIFGLIFWFSGTHGLAWLHMLLGILFVIVVWYLGVMQGLLDNGSLGLTLATFIVGLLLAIVGMTQTTILLGRAHWVIQVIHLLLALTAVGLGEISAARYNRGASAASPAASSRT
jgi:hypothetical protein